MLITNAKYYFSSWEDVADGIKILAEKIKKEVDIRDITEIVGIARGGLIPAVMLSHFLGIKYSAEVSLSLMNSDKVIIIDDIADSGRTFENIVIGNQTIICSLYMRSKRCSKKTRDNLIYAYEVNNDDWLVFPWEIGDR